MTGCPSCAGHLPLAYTELCKRCAVAALAILSRGTAARIASERGFAVDELTRNGVQLEDANWLDECERDAPKHRLMRLSWACVRGAKLDLVSRTALKPRATGLKR